MSPPADWRGGGWQRDGRQDGAVLLSESQHEHMPTKLQQLRQGVQNAGISNLSVSRRGRDAGGGWGAVEETREGGGQEGDSRKRGTRDSRAHKSITPAQDSKPHKGKLALERLRDRNRERLLLLGVQADAGGVEAEAVLPRPHTAGIQDRYARYARYAQCREGGHRAQTSLEAEIMSRVRERDDRRMMRARTETPTVRGYRLQQQQQGAERDTGESEFVAEALRLVRERNLEQSRLFNADPDAYCTHDFRRLRGGGRVRPVPARPKAYSHYSQTSDVTTRPAPGAASAELGLDHALGASSHTQQSLAPPVATETRGAMETVGATEAVGLLDTAAASGITAQELDRATRQLRARMVFENDSVTNLGHQLGYFSTVTNLDTYAALPDRIGAVTTDDVARVARTYLTESNRTVGWFEPISDS